MASQNSAEGRIQLRAEVFEKLARVAHSLGSPARLKLIQVLSQAPRTVEELAEAIGESVANTSQHLQRLAREGVVAVTKQGLAREYRLKNARVAALWEQLQDLAHELAPELNEAEAQLTDPALKSPLSSEEVLDQVARKRAILVDVRLPLEAEATPVQGAVSIPLADLKAQLRALEKDKPVYVFCRGKYCELASQAVKLLRQSGYKAFRLRESSFALNQLRKKET